MSIYEYFYRVIKSSWGVAIDIKGEITSKKNYALKSSCVEIALGLWGVILNSSLTIEEEKFLWDGLKLVSDEIILKSEYKSDTLIIFHSISYNLCDYQEEGLSAAIIKWAAGAFGFEPPQIDVKFNRELNKYEFEYVF